MPSLEAAPFLISIWMGLSTLRRTPGQECKSQTLEAALGHRLLAAADGPTSSALFVNTVYIQAHRQTPGLIFRPAIEGSQPTLALGVNKPHTALPTRFIPLEQASHPLQMLAVIASTNLHILLPRPWAAPP